MNAESSSEAREKTMHPSPGHRPASLGPLTSALILLLFALSIHPSRAGAAVLSQFNFPTTAASPAGNISPSTSATGLTSSAMTNGTNDVSRSAITDTLRIPSCASPPQATTLSGAVSANSYVEFTLTPDSGKELDLSSLTLKAARGGAGTPSPASTAGPWPTRRI